MVRLLTALGVRGALYIMPLVVLGAWFAVFFFRMGDVIAAAA